MVSTTILRVACVSVFAGAAVLAQGGGDAATFERLRAEGYDRSQAAAVFEHFTIDIGPRLTASPAHRQAAEWAKERLAQYGLSNARLESWNFGRGWTAERVVVEMTEPRSLSIIGYADGWSPSTAGDVLGAPVFIGGQKADAVAAMGPQLKGAIVMTQPMMTSFVRKDRPQPSDESYVANSAAYATSVGRPATPARTGPTEAQRVTAALQAAGAGVILKPSTGEHGTVFVTGRDGGPGAVPAVTISGEQYNMIVRMLERKIPVTLRVRVDAKFDDSQNGRAYNVLAELPGSDPLVRDEIVMIGGHLDSWHTGVGATDNADGATTMMEAMRILKAAGIQPRRTIRVALWGGEEQGLLGSRAWADAHLAGAANAAERDKFDVYFNIDNGYGKIYGFYTENSAPARQLFDRWIEPLKAIGARRNVTEGVGSTDHLSFIAAGVPGFNPIQSYEQYDMRTHHTNMDTLERLDENDLKQSAVAMAWIALQAANAPEKMPRQ